MSPAIDLDVARHALRRCVLFRDLDGSTMDACLRSLRHRHYRRDEVVFHQGDPGDALHVVVEGAVNIVLPSPGDAEPAILTTLHPGDFFGELALLDGAPHSATAVALEPTEALLLGREAFDRLLDAEPSLRRSLLASIAGELRRLTAHVEALHFLGLEARLAARVTMLVRDAAPDARRDVRIPWPYTQAELAGMIGAARETVNRLLGDLAGRDLLRVERDTLVVPDLDALAAVAGGPEGGA